jgi:hypothetical protein
MANPLRRIDPATRYVNVIDKTSSQEQDKLFDFTSGYLDYKGVNVAHDASEGATDWEITKYTWAAGILARIEGPLEGSWTGRAALAWG